MNRKGERVSLFGDKWEVRVMNMDEYIYVVACRGPIMAGESEFYIAPPDFIDKIRGITFENKVEKQVLKCKRWCERQNAKENITKEIVRRYAS